MAKAEPKTLLSEIAKASQGRIRIMDMRKPAEPAKAPEPERKAPQR